MLINPNTSDLAKPLAEVVIAAGSNDDSLFNFKEHRAGLDALAIYVHPKDGELDDLIKKVYGGGQTALDVQHLAMLFLDSGLIQVDGKLESTSRDEL